MTRRARITLHEIAQRASVSIATVSRTINCISSVDPSLAKRVRKAIEQIGYYPNTHARALVSGCSRIFGLMVSETISPFFPEIVQTFENLGFQNNYEIFLGSIACDPRQTEVAVRRMLERQVEGVAILSFGNEDGLVKAFGRRNVPVVVLDIESLAPPLRTVCIDYQSGTRQAVQHLAALGHVRIALITGPTCLKTTITRRVAVQECMKEIGLEIPPQLLMEGDHTLEAGMKAMSVLAALPDRPSAVLCLNDMTAIGVMRAGLEFAFRIPRDLSVVGFDDIRMAQFTVPPLTTIQIPPVEIAKKAFRALLDFVEPECNQPSHQDYVIKTNLVLRGSTALAPGRARNRAIGQRGDEQCGTGRDPEGQSVRA